MPLFSKHRDTLYAADGEALSPDAYDEGQAVHGFSNRTGKPNRQPLEFVVTVDRAGRKRFTLKGLFEC
jgi:hypothetical protein